MAGVTAGVIVAAGSAAYGAKQAKKAAKAGAAGYDAATAEQRRQFDLARADTQWIRDIGQRAGNQLATLYGVGTPNEDGTMPAPDYSAFYDSPDYQFARDEGMRGIERSAAARGGIASGNTLAELARYNSGLATQNFGNYTNRLASMAGMGQTSSENLAGQRLALGQQIGANAIGAGNARASGITDATNMYTNAANQIGGLFGYGYGKPKADGGMVYDSEPGMIDYGQGDGSGIDDQVPIDASRGEFIVPADVVAAVGEPFLNQLVAKFHTPAPAQRANGMANGGIAGRFGIFQQRMLPQIMQRFAPTTTPKMMSRPLMAPQAQKVPQAQTMGFAPRNQFLTPRFAYG